MTLQVVVFGATGRMGAAVVDKLAHSAFAYVGSVRRKAGSDQLEGVTAKGAVVSLESLLDSADVAIDFSLPEAVQRHVSLCQSHKLPYTCGVTALTDDTLEALDSAAKSLPVLWAPNMSTGVTVCFGAAADMAARLGQGFSVAITDIHHAGKMDAPSGTALEFGRVIEQASGGDVDITYDSVREGSHPGEHHIVFRSDGDLIELRHRAGDRAEFASGAIRAAEWLATRQSGLYNMRNVLGITSSS